ncbi:MAG TPA: hypothetical protein PLX41_04990 [Bacteroidales bacterium]|nr:hypothetical protein [Bacteroidales bacterium]HPR72999.1 hypothetical protein [Bacteroidales bacterium]
MIPGHTLIIPCPVCGHPGKKRTLISGNTFGARLWSDGKQIAPMLPEFPWLVKCKNCGKFFHAEEKLATRELEWDDEDYQQFKHIEDFDFPNFNEYFEALGLEENEQYLRFMIFTSFNDYVRNKMEDQITEEMQMLHEDNLKSLLYLIEKSEDQDFNALMTRIEINRELGRFDKCFELLNSITDEKHKDIKSKFMDEVVRKNRKVFRLY